MFERTTGVSSINLIKGVNYMVSVSSNFSKLYIRKGEMIMPIQLRLLAIILAVLFFCLYGKIGQKKIRVEIRHMLKWFVLALIILIGAIFPEMGSRIAHFLEFKP